jgi:hypothetical protein
MSTAQSPAKSPGRLDQSGCLLTFGIIQILLGSLFGMMGSLTVNTVAQGFLPGTPEGDAIPVQMMIPSAVTYFVLAVVFICLGVGSCQARRWAWTLTVVMSWMWLILGIVRYAFFLLFAEPMMSATVESMLNLPLEALVLIRFIAAVFLVAIYIVLPSLFLIFYWQSSVRVTCLCRDPQISWTDRCPMLVLPVSFVHALSAIYTSSMMANDCMIPVFGTILSGVVGAGVILGVTLATAYLAWGAYRLKMVAWWGTLLLWMLGILNMVTCSQSTLTAMYERMHMTGGQLAMIRRSGMIESMSRRMPWMGLVGGAILLGYLWYVRRHFAGNIKEDLAGIPPARKPYIEAQRGHEEAGEVS